MTEDNFQQRSISHTAKLKFDVLPLSFFLPADQFGPVRILSIISISDACAWVGAMMFVRNAIGNDWFEIGIFRLLSCRTVDPALAFLRVAALWWVI